jgi:hypothetical protein
MGQRQAPAALYHKEDPVLIAQETGWAAGLIWTCAYNLARTGIWYPDRNSLASRYTA